MTCLLEASGAVVVDCLFQFLHPTEAVRVGVSSSLLAAEFFKDCLWARSLGVASPLLHLMCLDRGVDESTRSEKCKPAMEELRCVAGFQDLPAVHGSDAFWLRCYGAWFASRRRHTRGT